jgi:hypothetical protein
VAGAEMPKSVVMTSPGAMTARGAVNVVVSHGAAGPVAAAVGEGCVFAVTEGGAEVADAFGSARNAGWLGHHCAAPLGMRRKHAMVSDERVAGRRHQSGQPRKQLEGCHHAVRAAAASDVAEEAEVFEGKATPECPPSALASGALVGELRSALLRHLLVEWLAADTPRAHGRRGRRRQRKAMAAARAVTRARRGAVAQRSGDEVAVSEPEPPGAS